MHEEQRQRAWQYLKSKKVDSALFTHPETVTWLTGYAPPLDMGPHHFSGGPAVVWMNRAAEFTLIVQDTLADYAGDFGQQPDCTLLTYETYTIDGPIESALNLREVLEAVVRAAPRPRQCGIETLTATGNQRDALLHVYMVPNFYVEIDGWLKPLRMVKTDEELGKLRAAFALADLGQQTARTAVSAGQREIDVWMQVQTAINAAAGMRTPLGNDCVVGSREANIGGWPLGHALRPGDNLIVDLSARSGGYWSDSCMTYYAGEPSADQRRLHTFIQEALDYAIGLIRPGVKANAVDAAVRAFIERGGYPVYPHHTGHGVGAGLHEEPRLVPYNETPLEAGMVLLLEPGVYFPGQYGCRIEDAVLVTADGAERLTTFDHGLP